MPEIGMLRSTRLQVLGFPHCEVMSLREHFFLHISDVYLPERAEVLAKLTPDVEANGVIVEFSDSGNKPRAYAVVRITPDRQS
jgi:hypothetical protein